MSLLGFLSGKEIAAPIDAVGNVFDKLFTSDEEKAVAAQAMEKLRQHPAELQVELNKVEAQHRSVFVAGWRPFIGWVCGLGLGFSFLVNPVIQWMANKPGPELPVDVMTELVIAMLGLAGLRTVEKFNGVSK